MTTGDSVGFIFCYGKEKDAHYLYEHYLPSEFWEGHLYMVPHHLNIYSLETSTSFFRHRLLLPLLCIIVISSHRPAEGGLGKCFIPFICKLSFHLAVEIFIGVRRGWSLYVRGSTCRCRDVECPWEFMVSHLELAEHLQLHWYPERCWVLTTFRSELFAVVTLNAWHWTETTEINGI